MEKRDTKSSPGACAARPRRVPASRDERRPGRAALRGLVPLLILTLAVACGRADDAGAPAGDGAPSAGPPTAAGPDASPPSTAGGAGGGGDAAAPGGGSGADGADSVVSPAPPPEAGERMTVRVFFTRDDRAVPVFREVPRTRAVLRAALDALLEGPTPDERERGFTSFFSAETAGMVRAVALDQDGHAVVDFADFSRILPNASSSAGSARFLAELNATVFQFPTVRSVTYRFEGDCEAFWEWIQYGGCQAMRRPGR